MKTLPESCRRASGLGGEAENPAIRQRGQPKFGNLVKKRADERQNVEKSINDRKILDKKMGTVIFHFHANVFVLGVLLQKVSVYIYCSV